jgi:hypothetical protein
MCDILSSGAGGAGAPFGRRHGGKERGMGIFALSGVGIVIMFIILVIEGGLLLWAAAKLAKVEEASFGRAMAAIVVGSFVEVLSYFLFSLISFLGHLFGFILGLILVILVIKLIFRTSFMKAFIVWIFNLLAVLVAIILASMLMASSLFLSRGI